MKFESSLLLSFKALRRRLPSSEQANGPSSVMGVTCLGTPRSLRTGNTATSITAISMDSAASELNKRGVRLLHVCIVCTLKSTSVQQSCQQCRFTRQRQFTLNKLSSSRIESFWIRTGDIRGCHARLSVLKPWHTMPKSLLLPLALRRRPAILL